MGVQDLGDKKRRKCEAIMGQNVLRAHTTDQHNVICVWVDQHNSGLVDLRLGTVMQQPTHQGSFVAGAVMTKIQAKAIISVEISGQMLTEMLTPGSLFDSRKVKCLEGLPEDAKLVMANVNFQGNLSLLFTSETSEGVHECTPMMSTET